MNIRACHQSFQYPSAYIMPTVSSAVVLSGRAIRKKMVH